jgi:hypothetical protein
MKQCPNCQTVYNDDTLSFCLNDGAALVASPEAAETVQMSFDKNPVRVNIAPDSVPTYTSMPPVAAAPPKSYTSLIVGGIVGLLLLLAFGGIAAFLLLRTSGDKSPVVMASPSPSVSPTVTPKDETAKLREEMANLQKQLQDQKNQKPNAPALPSAPPKEKQTTARANSPRDGFLALRSEPNSETGYRVAQIPHGAVLIVLGCPKPSNVGKMPGRWCQVIYNGQSGWAFDAFMTF